jgi:hypothetical protein
MYDRMAVEEKTCSRYTWFLQAAAAGRRRARVLINCGCCGQLIAVMLSCTLLLLLLLGLDASCHFPSFHICLYAQAIALLSKVPVHFVLLLLLLGLTMTGSTACSCRHT